MFIIREANESDHACIYATWLRSYRHSSSFARNVHEGVFFAQHHAIIEALLAQSRVLIATIEEDTSVILGWCCYEPGESVAGLEVPAVVHYVYVKPSFRKSGVASKLLDGVVIDGAMYTHDTNHLRGYIGTKIRKMVFNPYAAMTATKGKR